MLGEATVSEAEGLAYQRTYLDLLDGLAAEAASWPSVPVVDDASWGPLPRVNLSLKITSLYSQIDPLDFDGSVAAVKDLLRPIYRKASATGAALTLDLEQFRFRDLTLTVFTSLLDEEEFRDFAQPGIVLQAYLRDADRDLERLVAWARDRGRPFNLRLVKGAYWDYETVIAAQEGWPVPVFTHKPDTDAMYELLTRRMLEAADVVRPAFASHNVRSLAVAVETARELGVAQNGFELQMLHGMGDPIKAAACGLGLRVREYAPVGELIPGMAYLVRRLLENTANDSFLRQTFVEGAAVDELVRPPVTSADFGAEAAAAAGRGARDRPGGPRAVPQPAARRLLARGEPRRRTRPRCARCAAGLGRIYPLRIGGRDVETARTLASVNPAAPDEVVGTVAYGGRAEAEAAVAAARAALPAWRDAAPAERAAVLFRAAELMRAEATELSALMTLEAGKPWREAGGDVDEAIDFLEYYGREMLRLGTPRQMGHVPGEHNLYFYQPRGVALVIAPVELPARDPHGDDERGARRRQPGHRQAGRADPGHRRPDGPHPRGRRRAARHRQLPAQPGRRGRRLPRAPPGRGPHRLHRLHGRRAAHHQPGRAAPGRGRRQEGHRRDGRQERDHRGHRRRPRRGGRRDGGLGVPLRRAEVLGRLAGDRARGGPRRLRAASGGGHAQPARRPGRGPGHARAAGDHRRGARQDRGLRPRGPAGGDARRRRRAARGRRLAAASTSPRASSPRCGPTR